MVQVLLRMLEMLASADGSSVVTRILGGEVDDACVAAESGGAAGVADAGDIESRLLLADLATATTLSVILVFLPGFFLIGVDVGVTEVQEAGVKVAFLFPPDTETEIVVGSGISKSARIASSKRDFSSEPKTEAF